MFSVDHISFKEINKDNKIKLVLKCNNSDLADYAIKMVNYNKELPRIEIAGRFLSRVFLHRSVKWIQRKTGTRSHSISEAGTRQRSVFP